MATYTVTTALDGSVNGQLTLRDAITDANASAGQDIIEFDADAFAGGGLIRLTQGEIQITESLEITGLTDGATGQPLIIITGDASDDDETLLEDNPATAYDDTKITDVAASDFPLLDDNSRIFNVTAGDLSITDLVLTGGRTTGLMQSGGAITSVGNLTLENSVVAGNSTTQNDSLGGGFYAGGTVDLTDSTVSGNSTAGDYAGGGGFYAGGTVDLTNSTVSGNSTAGEGAFGGGFYTFSHATLDNSTVSGNSTAGDNSDGGGFYVGATLKLTNSTVSGNSTIDDNSEGGGFYAGATVELTDSKVSGNSTAGSSSKGGGFYASWTVELTDSTVSGNSATGNSSSGGGFYTEGAVELTNSTVSSNSTTTSESYGGGFYAEGAATLENGTVAGNSTAGDWADGGGFYAGGAVELTNSTVSGNSARAGVGGGVVAGINQDINISDSIILGNSAGNGDAELRVANNGKIIANGLSIVGANGAAFDAGAGDGGDDVDDDAADGLINANPARVFAQTVETLADANKDGTPETGTGVLGGLLADNGGPVQTIALNAADTNPAIDAAGGGNIPANDARGGARIDFPGADNNNGANTADLGAFEAAPPPTITSATYDADAGILVVTGTGFVDTSGPANDVDVSKLTIFGGRDGSRTLTSSDVDIDSATQFTVTLNAADKTAIEALLDANGTESSDGTDYRLDAADDWLVATTAGDTEDKDNEVTVSNVNAAPVITSDGGGAEAAIEVAENTTTVTTVTATDAEDDTDNDADTNVAFAIAGGADRALFEIATGDVLQFLGAPDFETPGDDQNVGHGGDGEADNVYDVIVSATDSNGATDTQTFSITVTDVVENAGGGNNGGGNNGGGTPDPVGPNDPVQPNDPIMGTDQGDILRLDSVTGSVTVNGGAGEDTVVVEQPVGDVTIGLSPEGYTFTTPDGQAVTVNDVENIQFNDRTLVVDTSPEAKVVLFMYEVVLDRLMDLDGLTGWLAAAGTGSSFGEIANGFLNSPEFMASFGELSNEAFVTQLYSSAFNRNPDQTGFDTWLAGLNDGTLTRGEVAAAFAQSTEMANLFQSHLNDGVFVLA